MGTVSYKVSPISYSGMKLALGTGKAMVEKAGGQPIHTTVLDTFVASLVTIIDALHGNLELIYKNQNLSGSGKADASLPYYVKAWNALDDLAKSSLDERDMVISQLQAQIQPRPYSSGNPIVDELRAQEIRRELRSSLSDSAGRYKVRADYLKACEDGSNPQFVHACETSPAKVIITPEDQEKGRMLRARAEHPQQVRDLEIFRVLRDALDYPFSYAKRIIKDLGMPVVGLDWGRVALEQNGNSQNIKLVSMRKYIFCDIEKLNKTTEAAAAKAGYVKQPWDDDNSLNLQ